MKRWALCTFLSFILGMSLNAQDGKAAPVDLGYEGPCPPPMCIVRARFSIEIFNFHKPRTECTSGFGLCIKTGMQYTCGFPPYCITGMNRQNVDELKIADGKVSGWFNIIGNKAELHLPKEIELQPGFTGTNFGVFHVDENMIYFQNQEGLVTSKVKPGAYPVQRSSQELLVVLDLTK